MRESFYFEPRAPIPSDYLAFIRRSDLAHIDEKVRVLCKTPVSDWTFRWCKILEDSLWQIRQGDHRVMFTVTPTRIVIVYACRKRGKTIGSNEMNLALDRVREYLKTGGEGR